MIRLAFFAYWVALTALLLMPDPKGLLGIEDWPSLLEDHGAHFLSLTLLAILAHAARFPLKTWRLVGLLTLYAVAIEAAHAVVPHRTLTAADMADNLLGVAVGTAVWWFLSGRRNTAKPQRPV